ncbi:glycosyltransferase [Rhodohalobacter mucosus]|uniref:Glycosyltransferase family 1 protein n=1 Tax=Rhodohalobacter mucosus TaxID=2079485 RepID=A0A316TR56_9BACT|nr:glycosyltransferase [Rhodohalobacter mucosus]PWN06171.1 glycosyltransferase family 1 protein [Rhodohalobacter mucosus]
MKVIDVAEFYTDQGGGVKTYINQKLKAAARLGHEMIVVAPGREAGEEERFGGRVIWVQGPPLPLDPRYVILWRQKEVHRILDREKPDIVEGSSAWTGGHFAGNWEGDAVKSLIFHQDPVAVYPQTLLGNLISMDQVDRMFGFYWNYLKRLSHKFDATIVSGQWLQARVREFGLKNPVAVPFGINKSFFSPQRRSNELRKKLLRELGLGENASLFVSISRFHPEKRLSTIIDGFIKASEKKEMGLIIFGSGPLKRWIKHKSDKSDHVKLMGFTSNRDDLADILASADFFVHGSGAETYGLVVAEALCSGLPIVVPDRGGAVELAGKEYSEIYATGKQDELAEALLSISNRDRSELCQAALQAAEDLICTVDEHFDLLFSIYEKMRRKKLS